MPDASGAVHRSPSTCFAGQSLDPGFDVAFGLSTHHQRFTCVRLLDSYLTEYVPPFPATLTTTTLDRRRLPRFEVCACTPTSRDLPSSWVKHRLHPYIGGCVRSTQTPDPFYWASSGARTNSLQSDRTLLWARPELPDPFQERCPGLCLGSDHIPYHRSPQTSR